MEERGLSMGEPGLSGTRMGVPLDAHWTCAEHVIPPISADAAPGWGEDPLEGLDLASASSRERGADDDEAARTKRWRRELAQPAPDPSGPATSTLRFATASRGPTSGRPTIRRR